MAAVFAACEVLTAAFAVWSAVLMDLAAVFSVPFVASFTALSPVLTYLCAVFTIPLEASFILLTPVSAACLMVRPGVPEGWRTCAAAFSAG